MCPRVEAAASTYCNTHECIHTEQLRFSGCFRRALACARSGAGQGRSAGERASQRVHVSSVQRSRIASRPWRDTQRLVSAWKDDATGLLHHWVNKDCSLFTNALVYSPPRAPRASPWPGWLGRTSASMTLVAGPPVPPSEAPLRALGALHEAPEGTAVHRGDAERASAAHRARLCKCRCTGSR